MSFFWRDCNDTNSWSSKMVGELEDYPNHGLRCLSRLCLNMMCWIRNTTTMSWAMPLDHGIMALEQEPGRPATPDVRMVAEALAEHGEQLTDAATELLRSLGTQEPRCCRSCQSISSYQTLWNKNPQRWQHDNVSPDISDLLLKKFLRFETWPTNNLYTEYICVNYT